ncbi:hypothetical protein BTR23_09585 [Alkalihalophilus pseudofirmus]|nr:hypothetical protein BTR23_09585 [Alkalihalophilus pseudofirmus]
MVDLLNFNIYLGLIITIVIYIITVWINGKKPILITSPMILSIVLVGFILWMGDISYVSYYEGGSLIAWFLGPAVIALAVPVKKNFHVLLKYKKSIIFGTLVGSLTAIMLNFWLFFLAGFSSTMVYSLIPKHVTTPIALELSKIMGGDPALTVGMTFFTGILGFLTVGYFLDKFSIKDPITRGLVIGVSFHGLGAVRAMQEGELTGAIGSIAFIMTGTITSFLIPILLIWFKSFL